MPPDITTGPLALGASPGVSISASGASPPGSDPLAALFASLLARGGSPAPMDTPLLKLGAKTPTLPQSGGKSTDPRKDKTTEDKAVASISISNAPSAAAIPLLLLPLPIQSQSIQNQTNRTKPTTPPIAEGAVGQKTMDTFPATASPLQGATDKTPDGELPLHDAWNDDSDVSAQFPTRFAASSLVTPALIPAASSASSVASLPLVSPALAEPALVEPALVEPALVEPALASVSSPTLARQVPQTGSSVAVPSSALSPAILNAALPTADTVHAAVTPAQATTTQTPVTLQGDRSVSTRAALSLPNLSLPNLSLPTVLRPAGILSMSALDLPGAQSERLQVNQVLPLKTVTVFGTASASAAAITAAPTAGQAITSVGSAEASANRLRDPIPTELQSDLLPNSEPRPQSGTLSAAPVTGGTSAANAAPVSAAPVSAAPVSAAPVNAAPVMTVDSEAGGRGFRLAPGIILPAAVSPLAAAQPTAALPQPGIADVRLTASDLTPLVDATAKRAAPLGRSRSAPASASGSAGVVLSPTPSLKVEPTLISGVMAENSWPPLSHTLSKMAADTLKSAGRVTGVTALSSDGNAPAQTTDTADQTAPSAPLTASETASQTVPAGRGLEIGLKLPQIPADTTIITRAQTVLAKPSGTTKSLLASLEPTFGGKRAERRTEGTDADASAAAATAPLETARTEAKTLTAPDRAEIVRQIAEGLDALPLPGKAGASEQMTLQLHPKDWGQLQVSVTLVPGARPEDAQTVTAHIVAASPQVKAALESGSGDLRHALHEAGLHLDRITVTVQSVQAEATPGGGHRGSEHGMSGGASHQASPDQKTGMSDAGRLETRTFETGKSETGMSSGQGSGTGTFAAFAGSHGGRQGGQPQAPAYLGRDAEDMSEAEAPRRPAAGQLDTRA